MRKRVRRILGSIVAGTLVSNAALAGEQVQFKGSTSVELPKPKRSMDDARTLKPDTERSSSGVDSGFLAPPAVENSPLSDRRLREQLDRKKNWIFADPKEEALDAKTAAFMKGEKGTGLYGNKWMTSDEEKGLVQKYLEGKNQRSRDSGQKDRENNRERPNEKENKRESVLSDKEDNELKENSSSFLNSEKNQINTPLFKADQNDLFSASALDKKLERDNVLEIPFGPKKPIGSPLEREEILQKQIAHEKEFDSILQNKLGTGTSLGRIDTLNPASDIGRIDFGTPGSTRMDRSLNLGRPAPATGSGVTFTDGGSSLSSRPAFDARGLNDSFGVSAIKTPSFAPSAQPAPTPDRPAFTPSPFSLPFPQRKF
jgi:hypothetical protein